MSRKTREIKKILVIKLGALGDFVQALAAMIGRPMAWGSTAVRPNGSGSSEGAQATSVAR